MDRYASSATLSGIPSSARGAANRTRTKSPTVTMPELATTVGDDYHMLRHANTSWQYTPRPLLFHAHGARVPIWTPTSMPSPTLFPSALEALETPSKARHIAASVSPADTWQYKTHVIAGVGLTTT